MLNLRVFEQAVEINAAVWAIEHCLSDLPTLHRWLNPALRCEPLAPSLDRLLEPSHPSWSIDLGSRSRFVVQIPLLQPSLDSLVVERQPGLVVWEFLGFFQGRDRWECQPLEGLLAESAAASLARLPAPRTLLRNRFEFTIPQPIVAWGFNQFAASWTQHDMRSQLQRFKRVAEEVQQMGC
jgi:hypothetical protein